MTWSMSAPQRLRFGEALPVAYEARPSSDLDCLRQPELNSKDAAWPHVEFGLAAALSNARRPAPRAGLLGDTRQHWNQWTGVLRLLSAPAPPAWWAVPAINSVGVSAGS